jgi:hypothetical protein
MAGNTQDWLNRRPRPGETCVFTHGYYGIAREQHSLISDWKRDALLFDRVYVSCLDPRSPPDIPFELSCGVGSRGKNLRYIP